MEKVLGALYQKLAEKIISSIPAEWEEIYYLGEVEPEKASWSSVFYFKEQSSKDFVKSHQIPDKYNVSDEIYNQLLDEANDFLLKIYDCFTDNNQPTWDQLRLYINNNGKFSIDFVYDKSNDHQLGQVERELLWAYETFEFIPKEGSYMRELLDNCLKNMGKQDDGTV